MWKYRFWRTRRPFLCENSKSPGNFRSKMVIFGRKGPILGQNMAKIEPFSGIPPPPIRKFSTNHLLDRRLSFPKRFPENSDSISRWKWRQKWKNELKHLFSAENPYFGRTDTILDVWTHFSLTIFGLEIDYSMRNADLATHKIKFFKSRKKFFFEKKSKNVKIKKKRILYTFFFIRIQITIVKFGNVFR